MPPSIHDRDVRLVSVMHVYISLQQLKIRRLQIQITTVLSGSSKRQTTLPFLTLSHRSLAAQAVNLYAIRTIQQLSQLQEKVKLKQHTGRVSKLFSSFFFLGFVHFLSFPLLSFLSVANLEFEHLRGYWVAYLPVVIHFYKH
jgi:hypothetical protein